jgi:hypothetical protein
METPTQEQIVRAFKAWEAVKFIDGPEKAEYMNLAAANKPTEVIGLICSTDDEGCLTCGS